MEQHQLFDTEYNYSMKTHSFFDSLDIKNIIEFRLQLYMNNTIFSIWFKPFEEHETYLFEKNMDNESHNFTYLKVILLDKSITLNIDYPVISFVFTTNKHMYPLISFTSGKLDIPFMERVKYNYKILDKKLKSKYEARGLFKQKGNWSDNMNF